MATNIGVKPDLSEFQAALKEAEKVAKSTATTVEGLADAVDGLKQRTSQGSGNPALEEKKLHALRVSHARQEAALKRKISLDQARDAESAFREQQRRYHHLRTFDNYGDFLGRGRSILGRDYDAIYKRTSSAVNRHAGITTNGGFLSGPGARRALGALGGIAGHVMTGAGGGGYGAMGSLLGTGAGALIGGPLGAAVGFIGSTILGKLGGGLDEAIPKVLNEGMHNAGLTRAFNDAAKGFHEIRDAARDAAIGMQIGYAESAQQAAVFARTAALKDSGDLRQSLQTAYGFGRGLGLGPEAGVSFMGTMRGTGAASDDRAARRIGLAVAEAIQKGGLGPQADEVLRAVQGFASTTTSMAFRAPDVTAFAGLMAAGGSLNLPGLNATGIAGLLNSANSALMQGGAAGMASQIYSYDILAKLNPDLDVFEAKRIQEGGLFSSAASTFGANSPAMRGAEAALRRARKDGDANGIRAAEAEIARYQRLATAPNADTKFIDATMQRLAGISNPGERYASMSRHLNMSIDGASAFSAMYASGQFHSIADRLGAMGIDLNTVKGDAFNQLGLIGGADRGQLNDIANRVLAGKDFKALTADQRSQLTGAMKGGDEQLRETLLRIVAQIGGPMSDTERANQAQIDIKNAAMRMADKLIPLTTQMKEGIHALVEKLAPNTEYGKMLSSEKVAQKQAYSLLASNPNLDRGVVDEYTRSINEAIASGNLEEAQRLQKDRAAYSEGRMARGAVTRMDGAPSAAGYGFSGDGRMSAANDPRSLAAGAPAAMAAAAGGASISGVAAASGTSRTYTMSDGSTQKRTGGTRAWRNNNPGNIEYGPFAVKMGAVGSDGRFAVFPTLEAGRKAKEALLFEGRGYRNKTLEQAISRWAPSHENNTSAYQAHMLAAVGGKSKKMHEYTDAERQALMATMERVEGFKAGKIENTPAPEPPRGRAANGSGTLDAKVLVTVGNQDGTPNNDVRAELTSAKYQPMPEGV